LLIERVSNLLKAALWKLLRNNNNAIGEKDRQYKKLFPSSSLRTVQK